MAEYGSVLITGASSGLGRALAEACATPGATLHLAGRDAARLEEAAAACRTRGATVHATVLDVGDAAGMQAWISGAGRLDLVIANAGISAGNADGSLETPEQTRRIFDINLTGMLNTVLPARDALLAQTPGADGWRGRIAVVASVVAFVATPHAPAYAASKAAVDRWTVGIAHAARRQGVLVTSVCPGFVRTPMTAHNTFPMPGLMDADRAAQIILRAVRKGRTRITFPWYMGVIGRLTALLPPRLFAAIAARHVDKGRG
jgi:short-subunit dehydrogenase